MLVYHGTSSAHLDAIRKEGIKPRGEEIGQWEHTIPSNPSCVYITDVYAGYFAAQAATKDNPDWLLVEIDMDQLQDSLLRPDEDFVAQALRGQKKRDFKNMTLLQITEFVRDNIDIWKHVWSNSLAGLGTASYKGVIPPEAIIRMSVYNPKSNAEMTMAAMDPTITVMNHILMSEKYELMTRWMFGEDIDVQEYIQAAHIVTVESGLMPDAKGLPTTADVVEMLSKREVKVADGCNVKGR
jgi:hypothetical protein